MCTSHNHWKHRMLLLAAAGLMAGFVTGCGGDDSTGRTDTAGTAQGEERLRGDGGNVDTLITFSFAGEQYSGSLCMANYVADENQTSLTCGDGENWTLTIEFPGDGAGSFNAADGVVAMLAMPPLRMYDSSEFAVSVSEYGKRGEAVIGTFSGTLAHMMMSSDVEEITEGSFAAARMVDIR